MVGFLSCTRAVMAVSAPEACTVTGEVFAVGGGYVSRVAVVESQGAFIKPSELSIESVQEHLEQIAFEILTAIARGQPTHHDAHQP